ncbi:MAG: NirD/YgiW/YdeI family stress tolerance protein [Treponema sp.]|nr:NirD/YgiW/YdeI family stress tolerance protein [Treponema sp.]
MKRVLFACSIVMLTFVGSFVNAQEGFRGPGPDVVTVDAAKGLRDGYPVILKGKIERFLGDEKYLFTDETGSIIVEIDDILWRGLSVDQNDMVEITGEIDKGFRRTEIEASGIKKMGTSGNSG